MEITESDYRKLLTQLEEFRELVENCNSIVLRWTRDGRIKFLNKFGQDFFGYSAREIVGRHVVGTIVPETETGGRDLKRLMDAILNNPAEFEQNTNENMRKDGERVWISWYNRLVHDPRGEVLEVLSVGHDVTVRRASELREKEYQARLNYLSKYSNDLIILLDDGFRFLETNERCWDCYGYTREEMLGMHATELRAPEARGDFDEQVGRAAKSGHALYDTVHMRKDGTKFPVEISLNAIDLDGKRLYQAVIRDISERRRAENAAKEHLRELEIYNKASVGRELKMIELEKEVNALMRELGRQPKYRAV